MLPNRLKIQFSEPPNSGIFKDTHGTEQVKARHLRSNAKGGKFLCLEPLFWQSEASLEIPWEPRAFSEGQRPSVSFATDERSRLFWERAETDLVEQLAAASERVFDAKLTPEAVRQRLLPSAIGC